MSNASHVYALKITIHFGMTCSLCVNPLATYSQLVLYNYGKSSSRHEDVPLVLPKHSVLWSSSIGTACMYVCMCSLQRNVLATDTAENSTNSTVLTSAVVHEQLCQYHTGSIDFIWLLAGLLGGLGCLRVASTPHVLPLSIVSCWGWRVSRDGPCRSQWN